MKLFHVPYRWLPCTFWGNLGHICADLTTGVANIFRWAPVIWFDRDWDWSHLADVMEYKLLRMAHLQEAVGSHVNNLRHAKTMRTCAELLRRLKADGYDDNAQKRFGRCLLAYGFANKQRANDQQQMGRLIGKHLINWWD